MSRLPLRPATSHARVLAAAVLGLAVLGYALPMFRPGGVARPMVRNGGAVANLARAGQGPAPMTVELGSWGAPIGSRFTFRIADRLTRTTRSAAAGARPAEVLDARCIVTTTVLDRRGDELLLRHDVRDLSLRDADGRSIAGDPLQVACAAACAAPVFVRLATDGRIRGYAFAEGLDGDQRGFLRGMLGLLSGEVRECEAMWRGTVEDTTGTFVADYRRIEAASGEVAVRRIRREYTTVFGQDLPPVHELRGAIEYRCDTARGFLAAVRLDEGLTRNVPSLDLQVVTDRVASVDLLAGERAAVDTEPMETERW